MSAEHPDQVRLKAALEAMARDVAGVVPTSGDLAFKLDVELPSAKASTAGGHDLDNYLFPVAQHFSHCGRRIVSAWGTKRTGTTSHVAIDVAGNAREMRGDWDFREVRTTVSTEGLAWKEAIAAGVKDVSLIPGQGGIDLQISFVLASRRNWTTLWKPAIDSLGRIFGVEHPAKPYNARDDRIVNLALHRFDDDSLGNDIQLGIWSRATLPAHGAIG